MRVITSIIGGVVLSLIVCPAHAGSGGAHYFARQLDATTPEHLLVEIGNGDRLDLSGLSLEGEAGGQRLELERFEIFSSTAEVLVHDGSNIRHAPLPKGAYFHGRVSGHEDSLAVLSVDDSGKAEGIVQLGERIWLLRDDQVGRQRPLRLAGQTLPQQTLGLTPEPMRCALDSVIQPTSSSADFGMQAAVSDPSLAALPTGQLYQATIAIESDGEFYARFGDSIRATQYIANLFAYASSLYERETQTRLTLGEINLWTNASSDPWTFTNTSLGLTDFKNYWLSQKQGVYRTTAHFLSGKNLNGGIAYINALCNNNYGYGLSTSLLGNFQLNNPQPLWDIYVVTHEIGHNFNSQHTHDYQNVGGDVRPVDDCPSNNLPGLNSLTGGIPGQGAGTIMSYCHQLSGGYNNVSLTFGYAPFAYGIKPYRVTDVMSRFVAQQAVNYPSCLPTITEGNAGLFSAVLPTSRSVQVGSTATAFGTMINTTGRDVSGCYLALPTPSSIPATFSYQSTDASNQLTGSINTPVNILAGNSQNFVFAITPNAAFNAANIPIVFDCADTAPAPTYSGVNTFLLSSSTTATPDLVAIGVTLSGDGVLRIPGASGNNLFVTAAINIGASGLVTAQADTGDMTLPLDLTICETSADGTCKTEPMPSVSSTLNTSQTATYTVFAHARGAIPFDPAGRRVFLKLSSAGVVRGATSVAVTTE